MKWSSEKLTKFTSASRYRDLPSRCRLHPGDVTEGWECPSPTYTGSGRVGSCRSGSSTAWERLQRTCSELTHVNHASSLHHCRIGHHASRSVSLSSLWSTAERCHSSELVALKIHFSGVWVYFRRSAGHWDWRPPHTRRGDFCLTIFTIMHNTRIMLCYLLVTSDEEGGNVFTSVCLSVRRITEKAVNGFWRNFLEGGTKWLHFGDDPDYHPDSGGVRSPIGEKVPNGLRSKLHS